MTVALFSNQMFNHVEDETDRLPSKDRVSYLDIAGFIISIISHIVDVGFDINLAYRYYIDNKTLYFITTLAFVFIPAFINTAFSIRMYVVDKREDINRSTNLTTKCTERGTYFILVLLFQLAPVLRYWDALRYAFKSKDAERKRDYENQRKYYELMVKEDSDVALLRVLECFLEAAPQQILQLTIIFLTKGQEFNSNTFTLVHQLLSIGSSFVSMAWAMASYHRLLRISLKTKDNISWAGTTFQFLWHFLVTVSRILCISVIASIFPSITIGAIVVHWLIMLVWLLCTETENHFCGDNHCCNIMFYSTFSTVYIFTYVTLNEGPTCLKYFFFYTMLFVENTIANLVWYFKSSKELQEASYYKPVFYMNIIPFVVGLIFMVLYYKCFHPSTGLNSRQLRIKFVNS